MMTLDQVPPGKSVKVLSIEGGHHCRQRLIRLGLRPGVVLRVLRSAPFSGPILVEGEDGTFMIGRGMASRVIVKEVG